MGSLACRTACSGGEGEGEGGRRGCLLPFLLRPLSPPVGPGSWRVLELVNGGIRGVTAAALVKTAAQPTRLAGAAFPLLEVLWRARCALTLGSALSLLFVIYLPPTILKL